MNSWKTARSYRFGTGCCCQIPGSLATSHSASKSSARSGRSSIKLPFKIGWYSKSMVRLGMPNSGKPPHTSRRPDLSETYASRAQWITMTAVPDIVAGGSTRSSKAPYASVTTPCPSQIPSSPSSTKVFPTLSPASNSDSFDRISHRAS